MLDATLYDEPEAGASLSSPVWLFTLTDLDLRAATTGRTLVLLPYNGNIGAHACVLDHRHANLQALGQLPRLDRATIRQETMT